MVFLAKLLAVFALKALTERSTEYPELMALAIILETVAFLAIAPLRVDFVQLLVFLNYRLESSRIFFVDEIHLLLPGLASLHVFTAHTVAVPAEVSLAKALAVELEAFGVPAVAPSAQVLLLVLHLLPP